MSEVAGEAKTVVLHPQTASGSIQKTHEAISTARKS